MEEQESCNSLKSKGNEFFAKRDYFNAEKLYTEAIERFDESHAILYTNRAAARLNLSPADCEGALADSTKALEFDAAFTKAYYRRALSLERLGMHRECFETWQSAYQNCEKTKWLAANFDAAKVSWIKMYRNVQIVNDDDLISRFRMLTDVRERLSTLAHFWNESSKYERFHHFKFLLRLIGGEGELSERNKELSYEMMIPMPLTNYEDLTRDTIGAWCDFFRLRDVERKTALLEMIWESLNSDEQTLVITDLRVFISQAYAYQISLETMRTEAIVEEGSDENEEETGADANANDTTSEVIEDGPGEERSIASTASISSEEIGS